MDVYLVDGTYELFRHYFAVPSSTDTNGEEIGAVRGVLTSIVSMLERGSTHIAVATDHVIESFRNEHYEHYKTGEGIEKELSSQFIPLEEALTAMGVMVWPMVEFEADDALAAAAHKCAEDSTVEQVIICTPDKDLAQCVESTRVVQLDRRRDIIRDESGVIEKFGVHPKSIPDYLALVGDTADGYPGLTGWGAKAASSVLAIYQKLESIPKDAQQWDPSIRSSRKLSATLNEHWEEALLFRYLATLRLDVPVFESVDDLYWRGPSPSFEATCARMKATDLLRRTNQVWQNRTW
jgi:5'-3' exonuclease